ncbi:hypothetical protein B0T19DRAFT_409768 [Cercophora scortea]|uniref:Uncharacterized protein n=1 Tax=Cercophora scortea TaxID=314031 RepID=A0AAE0J441_9PEZI|nr:hypothetical protein B0T19DRAFT_409768 [Cercophora scortea]
MNFQLIRHVGLLPRGCCGKGNAWILGTATRRSTASPPTLLSTATTTRMATRTFFTGRAFRPPQRLQIPSRNGVLLVNQCLRREASTSVASSPSRLKSSPPPPGSKLVYPDRMVIYHAGAGKTGFLAAMKLSTVFLFVFFDMLLTPSYLAAGEPLHKAAAVAVCGVIPLLYVAYSTSPFVTTIHLSVPSFARGSAEMLQRFAKNAPGNTRLDVTTMSLIGKPRVSSMTLADLRPMKKRLGMVNYERDTSFANANRKWWRFRAVGNFNIQKGNDKKVKTGWVWRELENGIFAKAAAGAGAKENDKN